MESVTLSTKYRLVIPRRTRERLGLRPGMKLTVLEKGGVTSLIEAVSALGRATIVPVDASLALGAAIVLR